MSLFYLLRTIAGFFLLLSNACICYFSDPIGFPSSKNPFIKPQPRFPQDPFFILSTMDQVVLDSRLIVRFYRYRGIIQTSQEVAPNIFNSPCVLLQAMQHISYVFHIQPHHALPDISDMYPVPINHNGLFCLAAYIC